MIFIFKISGTLGLILLIVSGIVYNHKGANSFVKLSFSLAITLCGLHILFYLLPMILRLIGGFLLEV